MADPIELLIQGRAHDLGGGFAVRRVLPSVKRRTVGPFIFLDHFGLGSVMELPGLEDLKAAGLLDRRPAIETVPDSRDLFDAPDVSAAEVLSGVPDADMDDEFEGYEEEENE